jgi:hypothetical protein
MPYLNPNASKLNNFLSSKSEQCNLNQLHTRMDYNVSIYLRMFGRFSWNSSGIAPPNVFGNIANPGSGPQIFTRRNAGMSGTWSILPRTFVNFRLGYLRYRRSSQPLGMGFDVTSLGFPAYFRDKVPTRTLPSCDVNGYTAAKRRLRQPGLRHDPVRTGYTDPATRPQTLLLTTDLRGFDEQT